MYELKKFGKVFTSKFVGTGPSSYKKRIYRDAVSQRLRNTALEYTVSVFILIALMPSNLTNLLYNDTSLISSTNVKPG